MSGNRITYSSISERTGISVATISRVVNRSSQVRKETREKVLSAMKDCGLDTSAFEIGKRPLIVFNVPTLKNIFYSPVISASRSAAERLGYDFLVSENALDGESLEIFREHMKELGARGLILANPLKESELEILSSDFYTVTCCESAPSDAFAYVNIDDRNAAYVAARHLITLGRKRIALLNGPMAFRYSSEREMGYRKALAEAHLSFDPSLVSYLGEDMDFDEGRKEALRLLNLENPPDAFFAISDILAVAAEKAAISKGLSVPRDVAIIGFDDTVASYVATPQVTTIRQPKGEIGEEAAKLLISLIEKREGINRSVLLETELVIRESTMI